MPFDAMLILLREGVEALLIVMTLVTTLKAAKLRKGLKWVYGGAITGNHGQSGHCFHPANCLSSSYIRLQS